MTSSRSVPPFKISTLFCHKVLLTTWKAVLLMYVSCSWVTNICLPSKICHIFVHVALLILAPTLNVHHDLLDMFACIPPSASVLNFIFYVVISYLVILFFQIFFKNFPKKADLTLVRVSVLSSWWHPCMSPTVQSMNYFFSGLVPLDTYISMNGAHQANQH